MGRQPENFRWLIFIPALLLMNLGLVTLLSIDPRYFYQQLIFSFVGLGLFWIFYRLDFSLYQYIDKFIYVGCVLFLLLTYLGPSIRGATRWLDIFGFRLQPSEIIKPFFILCLSSFIVKFPPVKLKRILYHSGLLVIPFLLVFRQPDLGNAIVFASIWLSLIILGGLPMTVLAGGAVLGGLGLPWGYNLLHEYQKLRLVTFLNPLVDPRGAGYNAIQSMISVGSGQLWGRGFGRGTQSLLKFLPEHHTDFIFASFTEEFGFLGSMVMLVAFFILFWQILKHAKFNTENRVVFLFCGGFFTYLFVQSVIHIGMNIGIVPITGITLPFVSYGGSSQIATWVGMGILMSAVSKAYRKP